MVIAPTFQALVSGLHRGDPGPGRAPCKGSSGAVLIAPSGGPVSVRRKPGPGVAQHFEEIDR